MTAAWAAIIVAAAIVVANVAGVWWVSRTQRGLAQAERLGEREIDAYLDLLRWIEKSQNWARKKPISEPAPKPPEDLEARLMAFARKRIFKPMKWPDGCSPTCIKTFTTSRNPN